MAYMLTQFYLSLYKLAVGVLQAEDLPGLDMSGTSDPYVKVGQSSKRKYYYNTSFTYRFTYCRTKRKNLRPKCTVKH